MNELEKKFREELDESAQLFIDPGNAEYFRRGAHWVFRWFSQQQWITDRDPELYGFYSVILKTDSGIQTHGLWWENGTWFFDNEMSQGEPIFTASWYLEVIGWQPLPLSPKP